VAVADKGVELKTDMGTDVIAGEAVAKAPEPVRASDTARGTVVAVTSLAAAVKLLYISIDGGLIAPTIPDAQCDDGVVTSQKNQMGELSFVMTKSQAGVGPSKFGPRPRNPLLNPPCRGWQGFSKLDCVTVWTSPPKTNVTVSLICADTVGGSKKLPSTPTITIWLVAARTLTVQVTKKT
jgi:hypothetical protein